MLPNKNAVEFGQEWQASKLYNSFGWQQLEPLTLLWLGWWPETMVWAWSNSKLWPSQDFFCMVSESTVLFQLKNIIQCKFKSSEHLELRASLSKQIYVIFILMTWGEHWGSWSLLFMCTVFTWLNSPSIYFKLGIVDSAFIWKLAWALYSWSNGFSSLIFTDINPSVISAAYYTSHKYFRSVFKTPPWRPGTCT